MSSSEADVSEPTCSSVAPEVIAHQFILPERQVKVVQLLKKMDSGDNTGTDDDVKYCICRSSDCSRFMIGCDRCNEWYHGDCIGVTQKDAKGIKKFYCARCRGKDHTLQIRYKSTKIPKQKLERSDSSDTDHHFYTRRHDKEKSKGTKSSRRCGECIACHFTSDCGRCDFCKDMKKFGGMNRLRQKCRLRQCVNFGLLICGLKSQEGEGEKGQSCTVTSVTESEYTEHSHDQSQDENRTRNRFSHSSPKRKAADTIQLKKKPKREKMKRKERNLSPKRSRQKSSESGKSSTKPRSHSKSCVEHLSSGSVSIDIKSRQCYGPGCVEAARPQSKYCSNECGLKLAKARLYELLPPKIQQWQSSQCIAEEGNKKALEKIRKQQLDARTKLHELDAKHKELDALIERAKHAKATPEQEGIDTDDETDLSVYCVTCGQEINPKTALKHMEKCFAKYEAQTSFGSIYQTRIEGNSMFCDYYNVVQKTYCKRLKVLCPEHSKEPKVSSDQVCGCPLVNNVFEATGEFCRTRKRSCNKHHCWDKLRRAEVDMERLRQWLRLDELYEQERNIRLAMSNRMGVLGLMLHQTIDHDPLNPIIPPVK